MGQAPRAASEGTSCRDDLQTTNVFVLRFISFCHFVKLLWHSTVCLTAHQSACFKVSMNKDYDYVITSTVASPLVFNLRQGGAYSASYTGRAAPTTVRLASPNC